MKILVTGATGFIGRHLVCRLVDSGHSVTLMLLSGVESGSQLPPPLAQRRNQFEVVYADIRNYQLTSRAIRDTNPDWVVHLAAAGVSDPFLNPNTAIRHNVTGTLNLIRACFEGKTSSSQVGQVIVARSSGEPSNLNVYAASKAAAWNFCQMYAQTRDWPIAGAMIFQAYGPWQPAHTLVQAAVRAALTSEDFPMTTGEQSRDWIYVGDVVTGIEAGLKVDLEPGTTFELGTGKATPVANVVRLIYRLIERGGKPQIGALPSRPGEIPSQIAVTEKTRQLLAWQPSNTLEEGLERTIQHIENE